MALLKAMTMPVRYFLIGLSALFLLVASRQMVLLNVSAQEDPFVQSIGEVATTTNTQSDPFVQPIGEVPTVPGSSSSSSSSSDPFVQPIGEVPTIPPSSGGSSGGGGQCPAQGCPGGGQPASSCPISSDQYPQCGGTSGLEGKNPANTYMITRFRDCHGNIARPYQIQDLGNLGQCQQATPTSGCTPNDQIRTEQDCVGQQFCTFNIWRGSSCNEGRGGAYGCQLVAGKCGYSNNPTSSSPSVSAPGNPSISGSPFCEGNSPAITWNWSIPANAETFNVNLPGTSSANYPASSGYRSETKRNLVSGQVHNASIVVSNSAGSNSATASVTAPDCGTSQAPSGGGRSQCPKPGESGTQQLSFCNNQFAYVGNVTVTERDSSGNPTRVHSVWSGNDNCVGDLICTTASTAACTPTTTQESSCVGNQLCTFNNNRVSDCTSSRTGPFSCQLIVGQCGYNPGSTCTIASTAQSVCVNAQLCTVNITRNTDCTISRSGPFNCQNSTQCGFSNPPAVGGSSAPVNTTNNNNNTNTVTVNNPPATTVVQSFGNVGVGQTVYTTYTQGVQYATALPKTGLPLLAWATGAFLPAGIGLRRFKKIKKELDGDGSFLWEERQFKAGD